MPFSRSSMQRRPPCSGFRLSSWSRADAGPGHQTHSLSSSVSGARAARLGAREPDSYRKIFPAASVALHERKNRKNTTTRFGSGAGVRQSPDAESSKVLSSTLSVPQAQVLRDPAPPFSNTAHSFCTSTMIVYSTNCDQKQSIQSARVHHSSCE
ncbi:hypothetical protein DFH06DRAFT_115404 [Mycena polygramma]|nr:hypothetical protein DFH06DRAFT_115404 [Mycena polygramma]